MDPRIFIAIIIIGFIIIYLVAKYGNMENFYTYNSYYKQYCPSCNWRSRRTCSKCLNCGYCETAQGVGECVPGDANGPFFRNDCVTWQYGDAYQYYPYANLYPVNLVKSSNPYFQKQLKKPYEWVKGNETE